MTPSPPPGMLETVVRAGRRRRLRAVSLAASSAAVAAVAAAAVVVALAGGRGAAPATLRPETLPPAPTAAVPTPGVGAPARRTPLRVVPPGAGRLLLGSGTSGLELARLSGAHGAPLPVAVGSTFTAVATDPGAGWVVSLTGADGRSQLATVGTDGTVRRFGPVLPGVIAVAVSPDGARVAVSTSSDTGRDPAAIVVLPMRGRSGAPRTWTVAKGDFAANQLDSLSWSPDGVTLSYIAGVQTGAGIAGPPAFLDTSRPGSVAPTTSPWRSDPSCTPDTAAWTGTTFTILRYCTDDRQEELVTVNARTGEPVAPVIEVGPRGCLGSTLSADPSTGRVLVGLCEMAYLVTGGRSVVLPGAPVRAVLAGS